MKGYLYNHQMIDAAPPPNQVWNFDEDAGDTQEDPRFSLGIETYPGRVLGATYSEDVIQLLPRLEREWEHIVAHYARIGLPHTQHVVWNDAYDVAYEYPDHALSTFFFGTHAHRTRPDERLYRIVERMNSKNICMRLCAERSVPTPHTICYDRKPEGEFETPAFPLYVKADTSVSGRGVVRCTDRAMLERVLGRVDAAVPLQLQEEVRDVAMFINVQYRVHRGVLSRSLITEQILDGNTHKGNRYPVTCEPWAYTDPLARYMYAEGMRDVFAFDLAIDARGALYMLECNPRYNGSTYPSAIANKLNIPEWSARNFETSARSLAEIRLSSLEYNERTRSGVVLVNWGPVQQGVLGILLAGTRQKQEELAVRLRDMLT